MRACLYSLLDTDFSEELPNNTNGKYKAAINEKFDDLLSKELLNSFEVSIYNPIWTGRGQNAPPPPRIFVKYLIICLTKLYEF